MAIPSSSSIAINIYVTIHHYCLALQPLYVSFKMVIRWKLSCCVCVWVVYVHTLGDLFYFLKSRDCNFFLFYPKWIWDATYFRLQLCKNCWMTRTGNCRMRCSEARTTCHNWVSGSCNCLPFLSFWMFLIMWHWIQFDLSLNVCVQYLLRVSNVMYCDVV